MSGTVLTMGAAERERPAPTSGAARRSATDMQGHKTPIILLILLSPVIITVGVLKLLLKMT
jgi:hypothetical protein